MASILVIDEESSIVELFCAWLRITGHLVSSASSISEARKILDATPVDVIVADLSLVGQDAGNDLPISIRQHNPATMFILLTSVPSMENALAALRFNAYDYLVKPVNESALLRSVARAAAHSQLLQEKLRLEADRDRHSEYLKELAGEIASISQHSQDLARVADLPSPSEVREIIALITEHCRRLELLLEQIRTLPDRPATA